MIYYAKIGTQLCFTLEVPIRVCFRKRKKKLLSLRAQHSSSQSSWEELLWNFTLMTCYSWKNVLIRVGSKYNSIFETFCVCLNFPPQCLSLPYSSKTYCNRILLHISLVKNNVYTPGEKMPCYRGCCHLNRFTFV